LDNLITAAADDLIKELDAISISLIVTLDSVW